MSLTRKQKMAAGGGVVALGVLAVALGGRDDVEIQPIGGGGGGGAGTSDLPIFNDGGSKKESVPTTIINYPEMVPYVSGTPDFSTFFASSGGGSYEATPSQSKKLYAGHIKQTTPFTPSRNLRQEQMKKLEKFKPSRNLRDEQMAIAKRMQRGGGKKTPKKGTSTAKGTAAMWVGLRALLGLS